MAESDISIPAEQGDSVSSDLGDRLIQAMRRQQNFIIFAKNTNTALPPWIIEIQQRQMIDQFQIGYAPDRWDTLLQFLEKRNFDLAEMEKGGLLSARGEGKGYLDRFRGRVIFPIANRTGKVIAFAGRILGEGQPKYLNSPESRLFNKSRILYNLHQSKHPSAKRGKSSF
jgi:DNA primase